MATIGRGRRIPTLGVLILGCLAGAGCHSWQHVHRGPDGPMARELEMVSHPPYVIEPPDILLINAVRVIPRPPYRIAPFDSLVIQFPAVPLPAKDADEIEAKLREAWAKEGLTLGGIYVVEPDGTVNLGRAYGSVRLEGMTLAEAREAVLKRMMVKFPKREEIESRGLVVELAESRGLQQIQGEHLVRPDGTIGLGTYGSVYVSGLSLPAAKAAIEAHLAQFLYNPEISLDVLGYNSKTFFVIFDLAGQGYQVTELPITGNETVMRAIAQVGGLPATAARNRMWIARPAPAGLDCEQILPVDWRGVAKAGNPKTNYQIFPGDRLYVQADPLLTTDTYLGRIIAPVERVFGIILLGSGMVQQVQGQNLNNQGGFGGF